MKKVLLISLFLVAFLERTIFDLGPNIELVTMAMILASFYLGKIQALWLVFLIMVTTDRIIGNTWIFIFTWSGFLIPAFFAGKVFKKLKIRKFNFRLRLLPLTGAGLAFNLFFYLWTNFGVWLLDTWGMYSKDLSGLLSCYINGLPFFKNQLVSTLIFIPLGFLAFEVAIRVAKRLRPASGLVRHEVQIWKV